MSDLAFVPASQIYYSADETRLFTPADGHVIILSFGSLHEIRSGVYRYLGLLPVPYYQSNDFFGGASISGGLLAWTRYNYTAQEYKLTRVRMDTVVPIDQTLEAVAGDLLDEAGLEAGDRDLTALGALVVDGFSRTHPMAARAALEALQRIHFFDLIETDWQLQARRRGDTDPDMVIDEDDLGAGGGERLQQRRTAELELPRTVAVDYLAIERDYQVAHQYASRTVTRALALEQIALPAVLADDRARQIAESLLYDAWTARDRYEASLPPRCIVLDPADLLEIRRASGETHFLRVTETGSVPAGAVKITAVAEAPALYTQTAPGATAAIPPKRIGYAGPTELLLLDLPALREADDDAGAYLAAVAHSSAWRGAQIFASSDGGASYTARTYIGVQATAGWAVNALPDGPTTVWDEANALAIQTNGTLYSASAEAVLGGANHVAIGAHGRWEILGYRDATDNEDGTWTCTGLLRGRLGTEHACASHAARDRAIGLDAAYLRRLPLELSERGSARYYKPVTIGMTLDDTAAQAFTGDAEALKPYSPVHIAATRDGSGNLTLTWVRRTRLGGAWLDYVDAPLHEASEAYEVDILDAGAVVRTIAGLTGPTASYTAAEQTTDFGGPQASLDVAVYQISAAVGRGHPGEATL